MSVTGPVKVVTGRTRKQLRKEAYLLRKKFGLEKEKLFPIVRFLEWIMPKIDPLFYLEPIEDSELLGRAAETIPEMHLIRVKQSVYDAACSGSYWARSVLTHELAHYILHSEEHITYAYPALGEKIPKQIDPEWQANVFAAELLVPIHLVNEVNERMVSKHYGVPQETARIQLEQASRIRHKHYQNARKKKRKTAERQLNR